MYRSLPEDVEDKEHILEGRGAISDQVLAIALNASTDPIDEYSELEITKTSP
jgi:hypothetical protein